MQARRLFPLLMVLVLAISGAAFATEGLTFQRYIIEYEATDEAGQTVTIPLRDEPGPEQDYILDYTDDAEMHAWIMLVSQRDIPLTRVHITAEYWTGTEMVQYTFFDTLNNTEWLDFTAAPAEQGLSLQLRGPDGSTLTGKQITISREPPMLSNQQSQVGENVTGGEITDPNAQGGDPNYVDPNAQGGDPNYVDPNAQGGDPNYVDPNAQGGDPNYVDPNAQGGDPNYVDPNAQGGDPNYVDPSAQSGEQGASEPVYFQQGQGNTETGPNVMLGNAQGTDVTLFSAGDVGAVPEQTLPPVEERSEYVEVLADNTVLYAAADQPMNNVFVSAGVISYDEYNEASTQLGADGTTLYCRVVLTDGATVGYLPLSSLRFLTPQEAQGHKTNLIAKQMPAMTNTQNYVSITGTGAQMYGDPLRADTLIGSLAQGTVVTYVASASNPTVLDSAGRLWLFVEYTAGENTQPQRGYVKVADGITPMSQEDATLRDKPQEQLVSHETAFARVKNDGTIMVDPSNGRTVAKLSKDAVVEFLENDPSAPLGTLYPDREKNLWLYAKYTDKDGNVTTAYIQQNTVKFMTKTDLDEYEKSKIPDQTPVPRDSDYATVRSNGTLLVNPATGQTIAKLNQGDIVVFQSAAANCYYVSTDKTLWMLVNVTNANGQVTSGYIQMNGIDFYTAQQEKERKEKDAAPVVDPDPKKDPTPEPWQRLPSEESRYGTVTGTNVIIRYTPGGEATGVRVTLGDVVLATSDRIVDDKLWYFVELTDKRTGYIRYDYLALMTPEQHMQHVRDEAAKAAQTQPDPVPKDKPVAPKISGYMRTTANNVPVLSWYNVGALPKASLPYGTVVYTQEQMYDDNGTTLWSYARYDSNNGWGFIPSAYLVAMTPQEIENHFRNQVPSTPDVAPTVAPSTFSGYALLSKDQVNFRNAASATATVISRLKQGTIVRVLSETSSGGFTWYRCESGGTTGYLRGDMISLLSVKDYQLLMSASPYYNQSGQVITPTATAKISGSATTWNTTPPSALSTISFITIPPLSTVSPSPSIDPNATATVDPLASPTDGGVAALTSPTADPSATLPPLTTDTPDFPTETSGGFSPPGLLTALVALLVLSAGGFYGYSVYNKARRKQAQDQAKRLVSERQKEMNQTGARPAVRRPTPPTQGANGAAGAAAGLAAAGTQQKPGTQPGAQARPGQPGAAQSGAQARPGQPGAGQPGAQARPDQPGGAASPYARPQQPGQAQRTQDVVSTMPRAQVDGKPVTGRPAGAQPGQPAQGQPGAAQQSGVNPYARPNGQQPRPQAGTQQRQAPAGDSLDRPLSQTGPARPQQPPRDGGTQGAGTPPATQQPARPNAAGSTGTTRNSPYASASPYAPPLGEQRGRMPVAPPPVEPDAEATAPETTAPTTPRRRRRQAEDAGAKDDE